MSARHPLTERILTRAKAVAIYIEGDSVEELTVEHLLLAIRSLEGDDEVREALGKVLADADNIIWPDKIAEFSPSEREEIESLEGSVDSKAMTLLKELNSAYVNAQDIDPKVPLDIWLKELLDSPKHSLLSEFVRDNGKGTQSQESLYEQWKKVDEKVAELKSELENSLIGQPIAIAMIARVSIKLSISHDRGA